MISAQSSSLLAMRRFIEGWTPEQVRLHRQLLGAALRAIDAFITSPKAGAMHADALRFWDYERSMLLQQAMHLNQITQGDNDYGPRT